MHTHRPHPTQPPNYSKPTIPSYSATFKPSPKPHNSTTTMSPASQPLYSRPILAQAVQTVDFPTMNPSMTSTYYTPLSHHVLPTHLYFTTWWFINKNFRLFPVYTNFYLRLTNYTKQIPPIKDPILPITTTPTTLLNPTLNLYPIQHTLPLKLPRLSHYTPRHSQSTPHQVINLTAPRYKKTLAK